MLWEIAQIEIKPGEEAAFEAVLPDAVPLFKRSRGCRSLQMQRSIEHPSRYRLVIEWETLEDHIVHFRGSEEFKEWRRLIGDYLASPPSVEHTQRLPVGFGIP